MPLPESVVKCLHSLVLSGRSNLAEGFHFLVLFPTVVYNYRIHVNTVISFFVISM